MLKLFFLYNKRKMNLYKIGEGVLANDFFTKYLDMEPVKKLIDEMKADCMAMIVANPQTKALDFEPTVELVEETFRVYLAMSSTKRAIKKCAAGMKKIFKTMDSPERRAKEYAEELDKVFQATGTTTHQTDELLELVSV